MGRLLPTALLCVVLLRATDQVRLPDSTMQGRSALLGTLSSVPIETEAAQTVTAEELPAGRLGVNRGPTRSQATLTGRISAGTEASPGAFPWMAALVLRGQGFVFCSAAVIDNHWLLTAAHCVRSYQPAEIDVLVGKYLRDADPNEARFQVTEIRLHPDNVPFSYRNDVALLRVGRSLVPAAEVIALPSTSCTVSNPDSCLVGETAVITGWGLLRGDTFELPGVLQKGAIPILDNRNCARRFARLRPPFVIYDSMLCAGAEFEGADTCQGDSGGPLVVPSGDSFTLEGVVSFGYGCGRPGYYGVYQRVAAFTDWIAAELAA